MYSHCLLGHLKSFCKVWWFSSMLLRKPALKTGCLYRWLWDLMKIQKFWACEKGLLSAYFCWKKQVKTTCFTHQGMWEPSPSIIFLRNNLGACNLTSSFQGAPVPSPEGRGGWGAAKSEVGGTAQGRCGEVMCVDDQSAQSLERGDPLICSLVSLRPAAAGKDRREILLGHSDESTIWWAYIICSSPWLAHTDVKSSSAECATKAIANKNPSPL